MAPPYAVEAFAGGGLFRLGFVVEGFHVAQTCEINRGAVQTLRLNTGDRIDVCDANDWEPQVPAGGIDLMFGGPPCQGFSQAGKQEGPAYKGHGYPLVLGWAKKYRPRYMVWENVSKVLTEKWRGWREGWWKEMRKLGYDGAAWNLLAADYGTPQARERAFFVLWRKGDKRAAERLSEPPPATHARPEIAEELGLPVWVTGFQRLHGGCCGGYGLYSCSFLNNDGDQCSGCIDGSRYNEAANEDWGDELPDATLDYILRDPRRITSKHVPADMSGTLEPRPRRWLLAPTQTANMSRGASYSLVIDPAAVVRTVDDLYELVKDQREGGMSVVRRLSVREAAKLQDVPQGYIFGGSVTSQYRQVGNGVPVNLARAVARHLLWGMGRSPRKTWAADPYSGLWPLDGDDTRCLRARRNVMERRGYGRPSQLVLVRTPDQAQRR
jgi:DNA (cytosine-5)-methyltransferase 1